MPDFHAAKITVPSVSRGIVLPAVSAPGHKPGKTAHLVNRSRRLGKITLAATYLKSRKIPCIWCQIDDKDDNPAAFFYYIGLAWQAGVAGGKKPLPLLTPEYLTGIKAFTLRYLARTVS